MEDIFKQIDNIVFESVDNALLEYRRSMSDSAWTSIENGKTPHQYNKKPTGDIYREFCKKLSEATGTRVTYEGLMTISSDYDRTASNLSNYRSTPRTANQFHTIIIHQPHSSSFNPHEQQKADDSYYESAKLVLERVGFRHLQDINGKTEWKYVYGRATNSTFTDKFTEQMDPKRFELYLNALGQSLRSQTVQESIKEENLPTI